MNFKWKCDVFIAGHRMEEENGERRKWLFYSSNIWSFEMGSMRIYLYSVQAKYHEMLATNITFPQQVIGAGNVKWLFYSSDIWSSLSGWEMNEAVEREREEECDVWSTSALCNMWCDLWCENCDQSLHCKLWCELWFVNYDVFIVMCDKSPIC